MVRRLDELLPVAGTGVLLTRGSVLDAARREVHSPPHAHPFSPLPPWWLFSPLCSRPVVATATVPATTRGSDERRPAAATGEAGACAGDVADLLAEICDKGTLTVSTDPAYPPQSSLNEQTGEYEGFDIDVATEIAKRLGVDVAWEAPSWDIITAGSWNGRWDTTVGSMTPTNERQEVLYFTEPYNYTPAVVVVRADNDEVSDLSTDLDGKKIGVCSPLHLLGLPREEARDRGLRRSTSSSTTPRSPATTPTRPRWRTSSTAASTPSSPR